MNAFAPRVMDLRRKAHATRFDGYEHAWGGGPSLPHEVKEANRAETLRKHWTYTAAIRKLCGLTCQCPACNEPRTPSND